MGFFFKLKNQDNICNMINFVFKYDGESVAVIDNISRLSNKDVWSKFEEAVTQKIKSTLISDLADIRQQLEDGGVQIECNFNSLTQDFNFKYLASSQLTDLIESRLK